MTPAAIEREFLAGFRRLGYASVPGRPLLDGDETVLLVNATITTFKAQILAGETIAPTVQVQRCFRSRGEDPFLLTFSMLGVVAMADALEPVTRDVMRFVGDVTGAPERGRLHTLIHVDDDDLRRAWLRQGRGQLHELRGRPGEIGARWRFGRSLPLRGRGLTIAFENPAAPPCGSGCHVTRCAWCPRFQHLGNIILVEQPGGPSYIDVGVGVEALGATWTGADVYALDILAPQVSRLQAAVRERRTARSLANLLSGIQVLVDAGLTPARRGVGYVLRNLLRRVVWQAHALTGATEPERLDAALGDLATRAELSRAAVHALLAEAEAYRRGLPERVRAARRMAATRRRAGSDGGAELAEEIRATFGLPDHVVAEILEEAPSPRRSPQSAGTPARA